MKVWRGEGNFLDFLKADPEVTLSDAELAELFDLDYHFKNVDRVFARVFGEHEEAQRGAGSSRPLTTSAA
jgi:adenylosuccinate lyase